MASCAAGQCGRWPVITEATSGSTPASSATSPRVEALMVSAVSDVRNSTASTTRPTSTWSALRQRATHPRRQLPPAAHAAQQQHQARDAQQRHGQRNACRTPAPGVAQQQRAVQVLHPARQRRGLPGPQHPAIGRVHIRRLCLVANKAEHHDGARGQAADFLASGTVRVTRSTSVATDRSAWCGGRLPGLLHRVEGQEGAAQAQHQARVPSRQAQPAVDGLPAHARGPYWSWKVSDWMYCLPACGLPALAVDSGTRISDGLSRMSSAAASTRIS
jgi:hypothetical protein